ncbi:hypothetical protein ACS0TY_028611 [Phlomoides rotata]
MVSSPTTAAGSGVTEDETPLIDDVVRSCVDFKGFAVVHSNTGGWKSASFIIGVEMAERFAYYGISSNLITYLTGTLGQSTSTAATNVNAWSGTAALTPLLGAFFADSLFGRYRTIILASLLYILGLGFLTLSAALNPFKSSYCKNAVNSKACYPPQLQVFFFFFSLYLVALALGGHKPCLQAFGADQFDEEDPKELKSKSSLFNWWSFCVCISVLVGLLVLSYIQENLSWELGFGIPCIVMCLALVIFLFGSMTYRFRIKRNERIPFVLISRVFVKAIRNWQASPAVVSVEALPCEEGVNFGILDKPMSEANGDIEDAKSILKLLPICFACLPFAIVYSQSTTLFTKQGATMDRHITARFQIPAAGLQAFTPASIVLFVPFYDRVVVPLARAITKNPSGISMLQRIGTGLVLGIFSMFIAGVTERKRLETASDYGLVDLPNAMVPMSVWWLTPQYLLLGVADVMVFVGLQEFFYDQVSSELKSMGLALSFAVAGVGGFLSSFFVSFADKVTGGGGGESWLSDNLNRAHLDYFYWVLAVLNVFSVALYVYFSRSYVYRARIAV